MKLVHTLPITTQTAPKGRKLFVAIDGYLLREKLRAAGFAWDSGMHVRSSFTPRHRQVKPGYWWTDEPAVAAEFSEHAEEDTLFLLAALLQSEEPFQRNGWYASQEGHDA